jgi:hypothetical protein
MVSKMRKFIPIFLVSLLALGACSGAKEQLGLNRKAPDEFAVAKRAPLAMPPDYSLRPPTPGAPRPQEMQSEDEAAQVVLGGASAKSAAPAKGESALLQQAGAQAAEPNIRMIVDRETAATAPKQQTVAKKLLNIGSNKNKEPAASVVDPKAEIERLNTNAATGKPVTTGETPSKVE